MQDIESYVMSNYHENMLYFEKKHPSLWKKLKALEVLLGEGKYPQKYDLEYTNDYFDIVDLSSGTYLYNTNSHKHSQSMADNVNYQKNEHIIETFYNYNFDEESVENARKLPANHTHAVTAPIISYCNKNLEKSMIMKKIYKFIFLGVGLGLHLEKIVKKIDPDVFFIVESDIELFRLSLFTCNYKNLFQNRDAFFSVAQNNQEFNDTFVSFYEFAFIRNHYLKFSLFSSKDDIYIKKIQAAILTRPENCYSHAALLEKGRRVLDKITEDYKFFSMLKKDDEFFKDKPILVLGAGHSLGVNKEWLLQNHDKFIIIAPFVTLRVLYHLDIAPDILVHIDEGDEVANRDIELYEGKSKFFENSLFVFSASVPEIFFNTFKKESIYLLEDRTHYKLNDNYIEVASVGETAYAIALSLSDSDIYMLGLDMSVSESGSTHTKTHNTKNSVDTGSANRVDDGADLRKSVLEIRGNFKEKTYTIPLFMMSINIMNKQTSNYKSDNQKVYNLSEGAYFEGTIPLHIENIKFDDSKQKEEYGAVDSKYGFVFNGFFKGINSDKVYDVDVSIDGVFVDRLRADKKLKTVDEKFDIQGNGFEFELDEKYFEKSHLVEFKESVSGDMLNNGSIKTIERTNIKFNEYRFLDSLNKQVDEERVKDLYTPNVIGFLATEENLEDEDFMGYIKELMVRFPDVEFKGFCFNDKEKQLGKTIFKNIKINFYISQNIYDITKEIEIYLSNSSNNHNVLKLLQSSQSIFSITFNKSLKTSFIHDIDKKFKNSNHFLFSHLNKLNITKNELDKIKHSLYRIVYLHISKGTGVQELKINDSMTRYDLNCILDVENILKNKKFKYNYIKYLEFYRNLE